ncbi:class I tRNA ligase family protein [Mycoplasmopsis californica]|nr:class I tRNA ligase family protein [Mycoplasmopsis californica]
MLKIYICGPTVYNDPHIGNLRPIVTFDLILKAFRFLNKPFLFIHNITDIDDKIINKAIKENTTEEKIAEKYTKKYLELLDILNINTISHIEKVTDNIDLINNYILRLVNSNNAYKDSQGNVWFDVRTNAQNYGVVSGQNLDKMIFEEESSEKKFSADFALWKKTKIGIKYQSDFGLGRPGWHTECCALIDKHFGAQGVDIHGGGMDLTFPHHENENIQHWALYKNDIAKNWIRCGQINLDGVKMSKSLGNVIYPEDFFNQYGVNIYKLLLLTSKLSAPINISDELINNLNSIQTKYKKVLFSIFSKHGVNFKVDNQNEEAKNIFTALSNYDFAKYNFLLNEQIKLFNKTKELKHATVIYTVLHIIHPEYTDVNKYQEALNLFYQWTHFTTEKDYFNADLIREKLQKTGLY